MSVIDFHSHVLNNIDDGSKSLEMSIEMLTESKKQGIDIQIATPHFYAHKMNPESYLVKRAEAYSVLKEEAGKLGIELLLGSEVAFFRGMSEWEFLEEFCITGTKLLLIEMPFRQWTSRDIDAIEELQYRGVRPVIAHLERFIPFQKKKDCINELINMDVIIQFNCEDLLDFWKRGKLLKLIANNDNVILGSDCHNVSTRVQNLGLGRELIAKKLGNECLARIDKFGSSLLDRN